MESKTESDGKKQDTERKPYSSPKVTEHGTVQEMTLGSGTHPSQTDALGNLS